MATDSFGPVSAEAQLEIREYRDGDEVAILEAYNRIFSAVVPGFRPRSLEAWRWQFLENPAGRRMWLAFDSDGRVINQQAGVPLRMRFDGEAAVWTQVVDSFSDPEHRSGLKKPGLFTIAAMPFSDNYGGPDRDAVMYGIPPRDAFRIGQKFLGYEAVRNQNKLVLMSDRASLGSAGGVDVEEVERFPESIVELFEAAAPRFGAATVRDATYLNWRFRHPEREYSRAIARRAGKIVGYAVYREGEFDHSRDGLVCDWLTAPDQPEAASALWAWLAESSFECGVERLVAVFPETAPDWVAFQLAGFRAERTRFYMVARAYRRPYDMRWLYRNWYYTLGDLDRC